MSLPDTPPIDSGAPPVREARAIHANMPPDAQARTSLQNVLDVLQQLNRDATIWPILRVQVLDSAIGTRIGASLQFAPGLPPGDHDLYPARVRPAAPVEPHEDTQLLDYVLPLVANYPTDGLDPAIEREIDARVHCLQGLAIAGTRGRDAIRRAIRIVPPRTTT